MGPLDVTVNLQGRDGGTVWNTEGASATFIVPAPGALFLLGLAGLATRRRRK
ncbi:MAG TPA: PEP-CTERM sorting domain-containing protein [Phycisphaerales bacterium]|nr:PEP-CTERM sorting domain-containing protein [Phycisphaerales bacterium]